MPIVHAAGCNHCLFVGCVCLKFKRLPKHRAEKTEYKGMKCDSKHEARTAADLDYLKMAGQIKDFRRGKTIDFVVNGVKICSYIPDFEVEHNDGTIEIVEAKGRFLMMKDSSFRIKRNLMQALFPDLKYRIVVN